MRGGRCRGGRMEGKGGRHSRPARSVRLHRQVFLTATRRMYVYYARNVIVDLTLLGFHSVLVLGAVVVLERERILILCSLSLLCFLTDGGYHFFYFLLLGDVRFRQM
ncbi:hypothetical protein QBC36DRAFT_334259 [Triangularia setosa]|uniref:Uncharacterized protein n=1 Tax=Triangularia setosa TaxID=2587417 RepID=A0AAN7A5L8_9PEZI|nr:hypothetical protein QBC36DRAFT_334259 [Podospora setosa]